MQRVDCQVRLSGKLTHTVGKKNISVAEIVALRAIHGADAVVDVQPKANDKTPHAAEMRSEEHTSELQSLMRISYAVFCLKKKTQRKQNISQNCKITNICHKKS